MVSDVAINVIDEDVDCPNIRVCQQNSENVPKINKIKRKDLTEEEKNEIANYLVLNCNNGKMKHGTIKKAHLKRQKKSNGVKYENMFCDPVTYSQAVTKFEAIEQGQKFVANSYYNNSIFFHNFIINKTRNFEYTYILTYRYV